ncbi:hypothetical protein [Rhodospirillaceae bacterium SYSU D60014]|uniref:hypothetical protein n=1 Tax=Virgifigura deserti TaxID=2268457 RepID=UPI000E66AB13
MQSTHIAFIAKQPIPIEFNTIVVREDGSVERHIPGRPVTFQFAYLGIPFTAHTQTEDNRPVLHLKGEVGPAPYSAESISARRATHAILRASWSLPHGRLVAWPGGRISVTGRVPLPRPLTPVALISAAVSVLLDLRPYLDLLGEFLPGRAEAAVG